MIRGWIELLLGQVGRAILSFYLNYSFIVNGLVLLYAIFILWVHNNLRRVVHRMEAMMVEIAQEMGEEPDPQKVHQQFLQRWKNQYGDERFILPSARDFWFTRTNGAEVLDLLHIEPEYTRMALSKNLGKPEPETFSPYVYFVWQQYRHNLLIGLRSKLRDPQVMEAKAVQSQRKDRAPSKKHPNQRNKQHER